jgi:hypothetical protein
MDSSCEGLPTESSLRCAQHLMAGIRWEPEHSLTPRAARSLVSSMSFSLSPLEVSCNRCRTATSRRFVGKYSPLGRQVSKPSTCSSCPDGTRPYSRITHVRDIRRHRWGTSDRADYPHRCVCVDSRSDRGSPWKCDRKNAPVRQSHRSILLIYSENII